MSKVDDAKRRARYMLDYKLEAVRLVKGGQLASVTARVLGMPSQSLHVLRNGVETYSVFIRCRKAKRAKPWVTRASPCRFLWAT
jgi:hypothetical protein